MSQLLESTASSEPTPPGTADPAPLEVREPAARTASVDEAPAPPPDRLQDIQNRQHPFAT